jgi:hypothetical protein
MDLVKFVERNLIAMIYYQRILFQRRKIMVKKKAEFKELKQFGLIEKKRNPIVVRAMDVDGNKFLDIRKMYYNDNDELAPTPKGIMIKGEDAEQIIDILNKNKKDILEMIEEEEEEESDEEEEEDDN